MKTIAGIDPGQTGAICLVMDNTISVYDMPVSARIHGKGNEVNGAELASMLMVSKPELVALELVSAMPGQGSSSMFRFGESFGIVKGVLAALQIPFIGVTPQAWKKKAGLLRKDKDVSRTLAIQQHPEISDKLARKMDCGRADAVHIAKFIL